MRQNSWPAHLYLLNATLLITHEIDSAFWKEWELFGVPGGIQGFLLFNVFVVLFVLFGFKQVLRGARRAPLFSLLLAGGGLFACGIHSYFILSGHPEFTLPASVVLLVLILFTSLAQAFETISGLVAGARTTP
jgi:hypothetical protein